jgi:hypothetical protein
MLEVTTYFVGGPATVVMFALVPVMLVLSVAVTACVVPTTLEDVKLTVATPLAFVVLVGVPNVPPFVLPHVTVLPDVATGLLWMSSNCAVIVTAVP